MNLSNLKPEEVKDIILDSIQKLSRDEIAKKFQEMNLLIVLKELKSKIIIFLVH